MPLINLPDGSQANFPDTMSDSDISAAIQKLNPQWVPKSTGTKAVDMLDAFMDGIGNQIPGMNHVPNTWGGDEPAAAKAIAQNTVDHPYMSGVGDMVGGSLPYAIIPGGALAKAGLGAKTLASGLIGAAQGAMQDDTTGMDTEDMLKSKALHALAGGALGAAGEYGAGKIGQFATDYAPKAAGAMKSKLKDLSPSARKDLGKFLLNGDVNTKPIITPLADTNGMIKKVATGMDNAGNTIGSAIDNADNAGNTFDTMRAATDVSAKYPKVMGAPINKAKIGALNDNRDNLLEYGATLDPANGNIPLKDAQGLKSDLGHTLSWTPMNPGEDAANKVGQDTYGIMKNYIEQGILPEDLQNFQNANKTYTNGSNAMEMLRNKSVSENGNDLGPLAAKIALASGEPSAILGAAGITVANRKGPALLAYGADKVGNKIPSLGVAPSIFNTINDFINQNSPGHPDQQGTDDQSSQ